MSKFLKLPTHPPLPSRDSNYPTDAETSEAALQKARLALLMVPQGPQFHMQRGRAMTDLATIYWRRLQFDEAISVWKQLLDMVQKNGDARELAMVYAALATTHSQKGDHKSAIDYGKRSVAYDNENPINLSLLANAFDGAGDDTNAFFWWRRLIKAYPTFQSAYESMGMLHFRRGEFLEAEKLLLRALELEPDSDVSLNELGNMYITMGRYEDALARFHEAQKHWPKSASAYNNIGNCYMKMGRYADAIKSYEARIQMRPKDALSANLSLGVILRLRADEKALERSDKHLRRALEIHQSGQARLLARLFEHEVRGALVLTALDQDGIVEKWRALLAHPDVEKVGVGPIADWRFLIKLLRQSPQPLKHVVAVADLLAEKYGADKS